ncbi:MacB family efflux pump subunit [Pseudooceanicola sp. GBMRC 2024]|uniref:Pyoverdine export ATP-binding/permease protein PvdT n=1 Tax=Pseudooceanicola albus TaxID=2692189 RepID=A0A6L7G3G2_9RHOB|nr:MacB family efflux pump subunit [Pseudooceanicola albus]MXN17910.1 MacB family efflux pump subunit [Pseudooceanicola albus]
MEPQETTPGEPVIELSGLGRVYPAGDGQTWVLRDVDLTIRRGEMVAIVGASGSGKSTLMNLIGCLDTPSAGRYRLFGRDVSALGPEELATARREHFGFIFQRYHLLNELSALGNVEMPAVYAGVAAADRHDRAAQLLERLGLAERTRNRPGQLSGGQQQRVSIARALMNHGDVILADEPTGALDSHSGEEVLRILRELHGEGHTILIVTHDMEVARQAERIIEIRDGAILDDRANPEFRALPAAPAAEAPVTARASGWLRQGRGQLREAFLMALRAMNAHRLRTVLTMLGIIIGIASVVCVVALGAGSRQMVLNNISNLGTNTLEIFAGQGFGDPHSERITTLSVGDADALEGQPYVAAVTPTVSTSGVARFASQEASALLNGVGAGYFTVKGTKLVEGSYFGAAAVDSYAQDVVIDTNARTALFDPDHVDPLGQVIIVGQVAMRVIGVVEAQTNGFGSSGNPSFYLPYTTVQTRFLGSSSLRSITLRVADDVDMDSAQSAVEQLLSRRHGTTDFHILNTDDIRKTITSTTETMTFLIAAIAVISLVVGGIGVMNIMLVSVSERVGEIGVRMAVGARQADILVQFLLEAVLVCLLGGVIGVAIALAAGPLISLVQPNYAFIYSPLTIALAFASSSLVGVVFGYLPARSASRLDPVVALSR